METGYRRTPNTREKISAHFIQKIKCVHNEKTVMDALWGPGISRNPYFAFKFKGGNKGDIIRISWVDNKGSSDTHETFII
jgi:sulfur-oxidizing protein SoxZ